MSAGWDSIDGKHCASKIAEIVSSASLPADDAPDLMKADYTGKSALYPGTGRPAGDGVLTSLRQIGAQRDSRCCAACGRAELMALDIAADIGQGETGWRRQQLAVMVLQISRYAVESVTVLPGRAPRRRDRPLIRFAGVLQRVAHELHAGAAMPLAPAGERLADQDWFDRVVARVKHDCTVYSMHGRQRVLTAGEELELVQQGKAGQPVSRHWWYTSGDPAAAYMLPGAVIEVVRPIATQSPLPG